MFVLSPITLPFSKVQMTWSLTGVANPDVRAAARWRSFFRHAVPAGADLGGGLA